MTVQDTLLPYLKDRESLTAVAEALIALFERWGVHEINQAELLGLSNGAMLEKGQPLPEDKTVLQRAGHLLAIDRELGKLYPYRVTLRDSWVLQKDAAFNNKSALEVMLVEGLEGILKVRAVLEKRLR